ncbi:MAG: hypothetical protein EOP88_21780 [Verrucomicrobiaceae bacterium]|nr:MAG: hypothetical protein EOP88_21780 [Verrucomicrobiaceae bacterium]
MRPILTTLLFPYFIPLMVISAIAFAWMLVTPNDPGVTGPTGGDVLGLYFMMICTLIGAVAQVVIGIPFCLLLRRIGSPVGRGLLAVVAAALALAPFTLASSDPSPSIPQLVAILAVVGGCLSVGVWIPLRNLHPRYHGHARPVGAGNLP